MTTEDDDNNGNNNDKVIVENGFNMNTENKNNNNEKLQEDTNTEPKTESELNHKQLVKEQEQGEEGGGEEEELEKEGGKEQKLTPEALAVIEMMKRQNIRQELQQLQQQQQPTSAQQQLLAALDPHRAMNYNTTTSTDSSSSSSQKKHSFWDTQPMPRGERSALPEGPIVPNKPLEEIRQEPYAMPVGFEWVNVNINETAQLTELYTLLTNNYVEDDDALFRFDYSPEFLLWALNPPGSNPDFLFGVRSTTTKKLIAFISGVPATTQAYNNTFPVVEINFLCVHKKLRAKRLAPVLIKEITRRVNLTGVFQAVYTAGQVLPVPVSSARYHHRSLNPKKLVKVGFSRLGSSHRMTMARMQKLYKLPSETCTPGLRPMKPSDVVAVHKLLTSYLQQFQLKILFTVDEVGHWLLPRDKVINSYVVVQNEKKNTSTTNDDEDDNDKVITDFLSFYHLPSSILHHDDTLFAAYSFYNIATSVPIQQLMKDALILAKSTGSDVFNALDLMDNKSFLEPLKFGIGDGNLQYYIYNWSCPEMPPEKVGIVLL